MDLERFGEIVSASVVGNAPITAEQVASTLSNDELVRAAYERGLSVGSLATTEALADPATDVAASEAAPIELELTPEQHERRITGLQTAMAERFSTNERRLASKDFGVVAVGEGERRKVVVMLTTGNGLYKGSYNQIMSDKKANVASYTIEIDGQKVDTREAMTWDVYKAFIIQAKAQGVSPLPDSETLRAHTWLTGEQPGDIHARSGSVYYDGDVPYRSWNLRGRLGGGMRFRPAAVV